MSIQRPLRYRLSGDLPGSRIRKNSDHRLPACQLHPKSWRLRLRLCFRVKTPGRLLSALLVGIVSSSTGAYGATPDRLGYQFTYSVSMPEKATGEVRLYFCARDRANTYAVHIAPKQIAIVKLVAGKEQALAKPRPCTIVGTTEIVVQRRLKRVVVGVGGRAVAMAEDPTYHGKKAAVLVKGAGLAAKLKRVQPLGKIVFDDDFMRAEAAGVWQPICGRWEVCAMRIHDRSANPFSLFARFPRTSAFRPLHQGRTRRFAGLGLRILYLPSGLRVEYVYPNTPAARADIRPEDVIQAVDNRAISTLSRRGTIARLLAVGDGRTSHKVRIRCARNGQWLDRTIELEPADLDLDRIEEDVTLKPAKIERKAIAVCGQPFWSDYVFEVSARSAGHGAMGPVFGWQDRANHWRIEWTGASVARSQKPNVVRLVRVLNGKAKVMAEKPGGFACETFYRLRTTVTLKAIRFAIDGTALLEHRLPQDDLLMGGKAGVYARDSNGVYFDDVRVRSIEEAGPGARLRAPTVVFEDDAMMRKWAGNPLWEWAAHGGGEFWHKYPFFGNVRIDIPLPPKKPVQLAISGLERKAETGYGLMCDAVAGTLELTRLDATVATGKLAGKASRLALDRRGNVVRAWVDRKAVLTYKDQAPLAGHNVGVVGLPDSTAKSVRVSSPNVLDYFFREAPVDWEVLSGVWGTMNRWVCEPAWSWFGGRHRAMAAIRHKGLFGGEMAVDVFCGPMMLAYWGGLHERPADLCVTICSKTGRLFDGYTVIFGGGENTWTRLYRNGQVVAETKDRQFLFPSGYSRDEFDMHRDWFHISLSKLGQLLRLRLYGTQALEFKDPEPLDNGRVIVWTCQNGVLVTRTRIACAKPQPVRFQPNCVAELADSVLTNAVDGEVRTQVNKSGKTYELTNTVCGGFFATRLKPDRVDLTKSPGLSFAFKPVRGAAKVDLYFEYGGTRHRVILTGPKDAPSCITLGAFEKQPAPEKSGWRTVAFGPLEHLRSRYPDRKAYVIEQPRLANYANDDYLLAGLSGNRAGTAYAIRDVKWMPPPKPARLRVLKAELPFEDPKNQSRVVFHLDQPWAAFNSSGVEVRVAPQGKPEHKLPLSHPSASYDPTTHSIVLDLEAARLSFAANQPVTFGLGRSGKPSDFVAKWTLDPSRDRVLPVVRVSGSKHRKRVVADLEHDAKGFFSVGLPNFVAGADAGGRLLRDDTTTTGGKYSLRVENMKMGVDFGVGWCADGFALGRLPILTFDHLIPNRTRSICLTVFIGRQGEAISFAPKTDGKWHRSEVNLFRLLKDRYPVASDLRAECLWFANSPWWRHGGSPEGAGFNLDSLTLSPVLGPKALDFDWYAWDISGIAKRRSGVTNREELVPKAELRDGQAFFCAAASDGSGNTCSLVRHGFEYDCTPPEVLKVNRDGPDEKARTVQVFELNGVDVKSIVFKAGGKTHRVDGRSLWFNQVSGWLHFRPQRPLERPFEMALVSMADFAGNALPKPIAWNVADVQPKPCVPPPPAKPKAKPEAKAKSVSKAKAMSKAK